MYDFCTYISGAADYTDFNLIHLYTDSIYIKFIIKTLTIIYRLDCLVHGNIYAF